MDSTSMKMAPGVRRYLVGAGVAAGIVAMAAGTGCAGTAPAPGLTERSASVHGEGGKRENEFEDDVVIEATALRTDRALDAAESAADRAGDVPQMSARAAGEEKMIAEATISVAPVEPPIDLGARRLVSILHAAMQSVSRGTGESAGQIAIGPMANRSRASDWEAEEMRARLRALLDRAGRAAGSQGVRFVDDADDPEDADAKISGRAYLLVVDGIDQWEIWITLREPEGVVPIWRNSEPIRLLRQPRPSGPQITRWPGSVPPPIRLSDGP